MSRKFLIGGNWKCNLTLKMANKLVKKVINKLSYDTSKVCNELLNIFLIFIEVVVAPMMT